MTHTIAVVGSANVDLVTQCARAPDAGETLYGRRFEAGVGGKGLNQAVACALQADAATQVHMVACLGRDTYGDLCQAAMDKVNVKRDYAVQTKEAATGVAVITVEDSGDNRILYTPGANGLLSVAHINAAAEMIQKAALVVCQLESPLETVAHVLQMAHKAGVRTVLNPAPVQVLPDALYKQIGLLVPNESEAALLSGQPVATIEDAKQVGKVLLNRGVQEAVIITLGGQGSVIVTRETCLHVPCKQVKAVDTTAAGDSFIGGLCAKLAVGASIEEAVRYGTAVAAITVTRHGASSSIPSRQEVQADT